MSLPPRFGAGLALAAFAAALLWPAFYNGQPIFFGDTSAYIRGADAGMQAFLHRRSAWSLSGANAIVPAHGASAAAPVPPADRSGVTHGSSIADKSVVYGRSPYYGMLLYLGDWAGGLWLSIALQACAVVLSIVLVLRATGMVRSRLLLLTGAACLVLATTAPFFASFLEPDIFAGVAVLACAALLGGAERLSRGERWAALALLAVCVLAHESHVLIVAVLFGLGVLSRILMRPAPRAAARWIGPAALGAAVLVAATGQLAFALAVRHVVGAAPLRPPYLMARMIEDGPGYRYLRATCPRSGFAVCAYLDRLPLESNMFLWDPSSRGVFSAVSPDVRRRLAAEQTRFVLAVLAYDPADEIDSAVRDVGAQLTMAGLDEFRYPPVLEQSFAEKIPQVYLRRMVHTAAYRGTMPIGPFSIVTLTVFVASAVVALAALVWPAWRRLLPPRLAAVTAWIVAGVLVNAVVCGVLSGPHNRYAARVAWVVPLAALLIGGAALERRRRSVPAAAAWAEQA